MTPTEQQQALMQAALTRQRVNYLVSTAWHSICEERNYKVDAFLGTTSRGTIAVISYLRANGL